MAGVVASTPLNPQDSTPEPPMHAGELQEQLTLLCYMWVRAPLPILAVCIYLGHLVWDMVPVSLTLGWVAITLGPLTLRAWFSARLRNDGRLAREPRKWARVLTAFAAVNGLLAGSAAPLFLGAIPPESQAMLVMVMCCWGAGAIATNGAYPPAYHAFILPLFLQMALGWMLFGWRDTVYIEAFTPDPITANDYLAQARERLYAIRDAYWPDVDALANIEGPGSTLNPA